MKAPVKIKGNHIYFGSGTKLKELSNFYESEIEYKEKVYNSVEHIYQSLKFKKEDRDRFTKNGDLGSYSALIKYGKIFYDNKSKEELEKKKTYWEKRKCIGIVAKLSANEKYSKKLKLTYIETPTDEIFKEILKIKYKNKKFRDILNNTKGYILIEFSRGAKRLYKKGIIEKWCGLADGGLLYGENTMGKWLMEIRDTL